MKKNNKEDEREIYNLDKVRIRMPSDSFDGIMPSIKANHNNLISFKNKYLEETNKSLRLSSMGFTNSLNPQQILGNSVSKIIIDPSRRNSINSSLSKYIFPSNLGAANWTVKPLVPYQSPIEGQIITVSEVLVEIQSSIKQEFLETRAEVREVKNNLQDMVSILQEDIKKKDLMLEELLDHFRDSQSKNVKKIKIEYNLKTCLLNIDGVLIQLKADSNQSEFCAVFFRNKRSYERVWELADLVRGLGEHSADMKDWYKKIESTIRHLNDRIEKETGFKLFIMFPNTSILINPRYIAPKSK